MFGNAFEFQKSLNHSWDSPIVPFAMAVTATAGSRRLTATEPRPHGSVRTTEFEVIAMIRRNRLCAGWTDRSSVWAPWLAMVILVSLAPVVLAQAPPADVAARLETGHKALVARVETLKRDKSLDRRLVADVDVFAKAVEWAVRHNEFYAPSSGKGISAWIGYAEKSLEIGMRRAEELAAGHPSWVLQPGSTIRGYYSKVDGSVQPYAVSLPTGINPRSGSRHRLHLKLHGRGTTLNELSFIAQHEGRALPGGQMFLQLDVFGRTNNAYRYSGETDVFEALADLERRFRIDNRRITLWGFSMGGAGAWHLGLHHPSRWSSVGPGAGFVDFYKYQEQTEQRPDHQHKTLSIYDVVPYALNAYNVPVCTYGGEIDKQLLASTTMVERAKRLDVPIKLLIGPGTGHRFHPRSFKEFMAFHDSHARKGRRTYPDRTDIRFVTWTIKYNTCEWLTIEEMQQLYRPAIMQATRAADGTLRLKTRNVTALQVSRDVADHIEIDGVKHPLATVAEGLLPGVYYRKNDKDWTVLDYDSSRNFRKNVELNKRRNLQGPIDDAFMQPFVCVRGTGTPWTKSQAEWADWTLDRFGREFDKWLRGRIRVVSDTVVNDEMIAANNLVLFGDPGSNAVMARVIQKLPVEWSREEIRVAGKSYDPATHGLSMIYPNPLNPNRYVVINSGHTFHELDFRNSNSWLFPRLGDIAVQSFAKNKAGGYDESIRWADLFDAAWQLAGPRDGKDTSKEQTGE